MKRQIADVANAGLYAAEGKYDMAAMSMLSAIPGVGDVLGPAAKVASKASKVLPSMTKVASKIEKGADLVNSPLGKVVTNGTPIVGTLGTAGYQAATGNSEGAMSTLTSLGLPVMGKFGGKALGNLAEGANNPAAKALFNFSGKAVSTGGMLAPAAMQAKNTHDTFEKWQRGEATAAEVFQSGMDLTTSTAGVKMANRMERNSQKSTHSEGIHLDTGVPTLKNLPRKDSGEVKSHPERDLENKVSSATKVNGNEIQFAGRKEHQTWVNDLTPYTGKRVQAGNRAIRAVIKENLPNLKLRYIPQFSPYATTGMARTYEPGRGTQIGYKSLENRNALVDVIVHEDLHHRWRDRGVEGDHHYRKGSPYPDDLRYKDMKFYATVARYMRMRGFEYSHRHVNQWAEYVKASKADRAKIVHDYEAHMPR